jgi:hypothetical protein
VRAELRSLDSPDALDGLDRWLPSDPTDFSITLGAVIGPPATPGGDLFYFTVVGPDWFASNPPGKGFRWGRGLLVLDRWDYEVARRAIADLCLRAEGPDWETVAQRLNQHGWWEFDGYRDEGASG